MTSSRRNFLAGAAALAVAKSAKSATVGEHHWGDVRLAVATYSLRKFSRSRSTKSLLARSVASSTSMRLSSIRSACAREYRIRGCLSGFLEEPMMGIDVSVGVPVFRVVTFVDRLARPPHVSLARCDVLVFRH